MSCNCGHNHNHMGPPHDCNHINHVFDPKPPAFYGTWHHLYGHDISQRVSLGQPGVQSGLYRKCGPLNCSCCGKVTMLTGVNTTAKLILTVTLTYSDSSMNKEIDIEPGKLYTIDYLNEGKVCQCTGLVTNIYKISQLDESTNIYKINIDCSTQYAHNMVVIKSDQLRGVVKYQPYYGEDTELSSAWHLYGTTIAQQILDAVIVDAELDKDKNLVKGKIIQGTLQNATTTSGICIGENNLKHEIVLYNASSTGGNVLDGLLVNGIVTGGDIDGEVEEDTGYIIHATVKGNLRNVLLADTKISGAYVSSNNGTLLTPIIEDSRVLNATITGNDMVTTNGITVGNITIHGTTVGGNAQGGTAIGKIDGKDFTILGGTTIGSNMVTTDGIVVGGTIIGGTRVGNAIYGATIQGGVCTRGITTGGSTKVDLTSKDIEAFIMNKGPIDLSKPALVPGIFITEPSKVWTTWNIQTRQNSKAMENYHREQIRFPLDRVSDENLVLATNNYDATRLFTNFGNVPIETCEGH